MFLTARIPNIKHRPVSVITQRVRKHTQLFAAEVGERWRIPVIVLYKGNADFQVTADAQVEITKDAAELVATLNSLISRRQKRFA